MRNTMISVIVVISLTVSPALAADTASDKVSGCIDIRNDFVFIEDGDNTTAQAINILLKRNQTGMYLETSRKTKGHVITMKPSFLLSKGPWTLLTGFSTNSKEADFVQAGIWYANSFGNVKVLADMRNYFGISKQANGYSDNLFRAMYSFGKLSVGADVVFDHIWNDGHNILLIGQRTSCQLSKDKCVYIRISREWNAVRAGTVETTCVRTGFAYAF